MTPADQLSMAISFAAAQHHLQFDKGGKPYILHCLKVMHYLKDQTDYELMAGAVMHDVVEDTGATYEQLEQQGFSSRVIEIVRGMTKLPGQTPGEYLQQLMHNVDCVKVKLADLRHNSDIRRLKGVGEKDFKRIAKYMQMHETLTKHLQDLE